MNITKTNSANYLKAVAANTRNSCIVPTTKLVDIIVAAKMARLECQAVVKVDGETAVAVALNANTITTVNSVGDLNAAIVAYSL